jgi:DNA-directed RNA polymerase specialized sigma24 family protein
MESTLSNHKNPVLSGIMRDEEEKLFKQRLLKLDTKYRVLIEMKLEGAMDKQIAAKLDCSIPSVSNWFKKACSLLSKS